jgi:mono/diheme cytochrome c family protein
VVDDDSSAKVPRPFFIAWFLLIAVSVVPLLIVLKMRVTNSSSPRFHIFFDMDFSPARDAQQGSTLFADGRAMRPDVPGTVARGELGQDMNFLTGIDMEALAAVDPPRADRLVRGYAEPQQDDAATEVETAETASTDAADAAKPPPSVMDTTPWLEENPLEVTTELVERGQNYFGIYCSVCHGMNGGGNGLVNRRALKILASTWIPPSPLHQEILYEDKYPDGKLFNTISNGIRKMPGYAGQIKARDRWAIVAYVRALQRSQDATIDLVPEDRRDEIQTLKAVIDKKLAEQAEAERKAEEERAKKAAEKAT